MRTIPLERKRTPASIGFLLTITMWLILIAGSRVPDNRPEFGDFPFAAVFFLMAPGCMVWTLVDAIKGKKWGLLGFVLSAVVPAALTWAGIWQINRK